MINRAMYGIATAAAGPEPGLPRTGASQNALIVLGLVMILGGLIFIALTRRPDEV